MFNLHCCWINMQTSHIHTHTLGILTIHSTIQGEDFSWGHRLSLKFYFSVWIPKQFPPTLTNLWHAYYLVGSYIALRNHCSTHSLKWSCPKYSSLVFKQLAIPRTCIHIWGHLATEEAACSRCSKNNYYASTYVNIYNICVCDSNI